MHNTVDLHTHSTASDGLYSPTILLEKAQEAGLHVLALTDHDTTNGLDEAAEAARARDIEFIPGIEINTTVGKSEIHVLGYYLEYKRPEFQATIKILRDARELRGKRMVELLNENGINISWDRVRELAAGAVGRPHVAQALVEAGYVQSVAEAFDQYIGSGRIAYVPRYKLSPADAVRLIASANGLPVMAHPVSLPGLDELRNWLPELCHAGLVGLESYYGDYSDEDVQALLALAKEYNLIPTGGTDFHGPGIHPTPLGARYVPYESVERLKEAAAKRKGQNPPAFTLPEPVKE
uniref:PHP-like protein n=1 Tax=Thermosporothrix sp. COM3 TaxID=2490863 RepID=A0A455SQ74_9CHLR|nr:PHP-like protein [Thermosporothrix sp. COM3]